MTSKKVFSNSIYLMCVMGIFLCTEAFAQTKSGNVFNQAYEVLHVTFLNARNIVYVLSGFGLIGVAVGAIMGKINFKWLAMICIALAVLAGADEIISYAVSNGVELDESYRGIGQDDFDLDLQWESY